MAGEEMASVETSTPVHRPNNMALWNSGSLPPRSVETPAPGRSGFVCFPQRQPAVEITPLRGIRWGKLRSWRDSSLGRQNGMMLPRMGPNQQLGGLKAVGISHLMRHCGIGVVKWIRQFPQCRPITGELSRRCFYMVGENPQQCYNAQVWMRQRPVDSICSRRRPDLAGRSHGTSGERRVSPTCPA